MDARYLTVDFIIESDSDLTYLAEFLENKVFFLWKELNSDRSSIAIETNNYNASGPEENIQEFLNLIELLPDDLKQLWSNIVRKIVDIGYECGSMEDPINSFIKPDTVKRLSQLDCAINIRIYPSIELHEDPV